MPAAKDVRPSLDRVFVGNALIKCADAAPTIVIDVNHGRFLPATFPQNAPLQYRCHDIVPVFENVRFHDEILPDRAFDRIAAAIDQRL